MSALTAWLQYPMQLIGDELLQAYVSVIYAFARSAIYTEHHLPAS